MNRPSAWHLATGTATRGPLGFTLISVATHASVVALAVAGTAHPRTFARSHDAFATEQVELTLLARRPTPATAFAVDPRRAAPHRPKAPSAPGPSPAPTLNLALVPVPSPAPNIDFDRLASAYEPLADSAGSRLTRGVFGIIPERDAIYSQDVVERAAAPRPGNPVPVYPPSLMRAEVQARLVVVFVIDTTGRVEERSIRFHDDDNELFQLAIRASLHRSRFFPAELASRPVRALVQQVFVFRMAPM